ncbi:MAG: hypothetical protein AAF934_02690, partial [Bacteroidota bacterium]
SSSRKNSILNAMIKNKKNLTINDLKFFFLREKNEQAKNPVYYQNMLCRTQIIIVIPKTFLKMCNKSDNISTYVM